jgi:MoxR-like ATPase
VDAWSAAEAILCSDVPKILLYGPPGTGKTTAACRVGLNGRKLSVVTLTEDMPSETLRGHFVSDGAGFQWLDGPAIDAWRTGGRLVLNEMDHAQGDAMDLLHVICDDPREAALTLPNVERETVRPAEMFQTVAAINGDPDSLPEALADRFPVRIDIREVNAAALMRLSEDIREAAKRTSCLQDRKRRIGIRAWLAYDNLRGQVGDDIAAYAVFGPTWHDVLAQLQIGGSA